MPDSRKIGERLTALRGDKSREEVAGGIGVSVSALAMYEQGNRIPKDDIKVRIANYFSDTVQGIFFTE